MQGPEVEGGGLLVIEVVIVRRACALGERERESWAQRIGRRRGGVWMVNPPVVVVGRELGDDGDQCDIQLFDCADPTKARW